VSSPRDPDAELSAWLQRAAPEALSHGRPIGKAPPSAITAARGMMVRRR